MMKGFRQIRFVRQVSVWRALVALLSHAYYLLDQWLEREFVIPIYYMTYEDMPHVSASFHATHYT
jgi:hypothetical protein